MGCDIHIVVEQKVEDRWIAVNIVRSLHTYPTQEREIGWTTSPAKSRNYERFAALAGVRGEGPEARGLPPDVSETTKYLAEGCDWHSHSWLPLKEAAAIFLKTDHYKTDDWSKKYPGCFYFGVDEEDEDQHRVVFWFDN